MKIRTSLFFFIVTLTILDSSLNAQQLKVDAKVNAKEDEASASVSISIDKSNENKSKTTSYPVEYRGLQLGMNIDDVKKALLSDGLYGYRGDRDVSLLPTENRVLIETAGYSFLNRSWFQFYEDKLYTMIFKLDEKRVDFYSIFKTLQEKYGEPTSLDPEKIVWKNDSVTLSLERPLLLKYIDTQVFKTIQNNSIIEKNLEEVTRKGFLDTL